MDRLLRLPEVAERLGIAEKTLRNWRVKKQGPPCARVGGRLVMYREADVDAWIKSQFEQPAEVAS